MSNTLDSDVKYTLPPSDASDPNIIADWLANFDWRCVDITQSRERPLLEMKYRYVDCINDTSFATVCANYGTHVLAKSKTPNKQAMMKALIAVMSTTIAMKAKCDKDLEAKHETNTGEQGVNINDAVRVTVTFNQTENSFCHLKSRVKLVCSCEELRVVHDNICQKLESLDALARSIIHMATLNLYRYNYHFKTEITEPTLRMMDAAGIMPLWTDFGLEDSDLFTMLRTNIYHLTKEIKWYITTSGDIPTAIDTRLRQFGSGYGKLGIMANIADLADRKPYLKFYLQTREAVAGDFVRAQALAAELRKKPDASYCEDAVAFGSVESTTDLPANYGTMYGDLVVAICRHCMRHRKDQKFFKENSPRNVDYIITKLKQLEKMFDNLTTQGHPNQSLAKE